MGRFCTKCGYEMFDDAVFCDYCGNRLRTRTSPALHARDAEEDRTGAPTPGSEALVKAKTESSATRREVAPPQIDAEVTAAGARPLGLRWMVVICATLVLLAGLLPFEPGSGLLITWWMWFLYAIPAVAALAICAYGRRRHQLAAFGFLALDAILAYEDLGAYHAHSPAYWMIALGATAGAICALAIGLTARDK